MPVFKKIYPIIAPEDAVEDLRRCIEEHMSNEDFALIDFRVNFSGIGETDADVAIVCWTNDTDPGIFPWTADQSGADSVKWEAVPQACGGGDPT